IGLRGRVMGEADLHGEKRERCNDEEKRRPAVSMNCARGPSDVNAPRLVLYACHNEAEYPCASVMRLRCQGNFPHRAPTVILPCSSKFFEVESIENINMKSNARPSVKQILNQAESVHAKGRSE